MRRATILRQLSESLAKVTSPEHRLSLGSKPELFRGFSTLTGGGPLLLGFGQDSSTKHLQLQIVNALRLGERGRARNLLSDLGEGNNRLSADDFLHILRYCAKSPDPLFVLETWSLMEKKEITFKNISYLLMMRALCEGGYLEEAGNLLKVIIERHGIYPMLPIYNCFLAACTKMQSTLHANQCLDLMELQRVGKNEGTYIELLKLAVWQKNLSAVHEFWKDYINHYIPSMICLQKFIWAFTKLKDTGSAYEALQNLISLGFSEICFHNTASGHLYSSRLDIPMPSKGQLGPQVLDFRNNEFSPCSEMQNDACGVNQLIGASADMWVSAIAVISNFDKDHSAKKAFRLSFNDLIKACARAHKFDDVEQLFNQMQLLGLEPSSHTFDGLVRAVISTRGFKAGIDMLKVMEQKKIKPLASTFAALSVECSGALELDLAEDLLDLSKCPYPYPYNAFLEACDIKDQPERAIKILHIMRENKVQRDIRTYEHLFSLFGNFNTPYEEGDMQNQVEEEDMQSQVDCAKRIHAIEGAMASSGLSHSRLTMMNLLRALGAAGMMRERCFKEGCGNSFIVPGMLEYLKKADRLFFHSDISAGTFFYNTVLHALPKTNEFQCALEIFKSMKIRGIKPNDITYNHMLSCCVAINSFSTACGIVSIMIRDGFYPDIVTFTALIKIQFECGNFDEGLRLLDQATAVSDQLDVVLYNTILRKAYYKGRIDIMEFIIVKMRREGIQPDPSTCCHVFSAYICSFSQFIKISVDQGAELLSQLPPHVVITAIEAMQVLSMWMISYDEHVLQEKRVELEGDFILSEAPNTETRIMELFNNADETLCVALLNLRWCALLGFEISWSPDKSVWCRRLAMNYDSVRKDMVLEQK